MGDGVMITVKIEVKAEAVESFLATLPDSTAEVAKRQGFRSMTCTRDKDNPNLFMWVEYWDSAAEYDAYIAWRTQRGDLEGFNAIAVGEIEFGYWTETILSI